jgi:4-alpha-glucanotransferase
MTGRNPLLERRRAGILCHLTSLPGPRAKGVIGSGAVRFLDFMHDAGLKVWQLLPLNPPDAVQSPYHSESAFAIDTDLVDWPALAGSGEADPGELVRQDSEAFEAFCSTHRYWLDDFALFTVAREQFNAPWWEWPLPLRDHDAGALEGFRHKHRALIDDIVARQFVAHRSWHHLRGEAHARDITVIGDMPLYPAADSAEVWSHAELFQLDENRAMRFVAGVPPDYFSETGQLWGNPVFDWERMEKTRFAWWVERVRTQLDLFDLVRIDHFLGIEAYWKVPAHASTAVHGQWCKAPGHALLVRLQEVFDPLPLIAEDLGTVTPAVEKLRDAFGLPGMRVMQFGFSGDEDNPHVPETYVPESVAYTGTHDNDTTLGWYRKLDKKLRANVHALTGPKPDIPWSLIRLLFETRANTVIVPLQDYLALDSDARMNVPGRAEGNWRWRFSWREIPDDLTVRIRQLVRTTGRG